MVSYANRNRTADVLSFAVPGCGLVVAVIMLVGAIGGFDFMGMTSWFVIAGILLSMVSLLVHIKGVDDEADRNFRAILADLGFLLLVLVGFALSPQPWAWLAVVAYLVLPVAGVLCMSHFDTRAPQWIGLITATLGLLVAFLVLPWYLALAQDVIGTGTYYLLALLPVLGYACLLGKRIDQELNL